MVARPGLGCKLAETAKCLSHWVSAGPCPGGPVARAGLWNRAPSTDPRGLAARGRCWRHSSKRRVDLDTRVGRWITATVLDVCKNSFVVVELVYFNIHSL